MQILGSTSILCSLNGVAVDSNSLFRESIFAPLPELSNPFSSHPEDELMLDHYHSLIH